MLRHDLVDVSLDVWPDPVEVCRDIFIRAMFREDAGGRADNGAVDKSARAKYYSMVDERRRAE